MSLNLVLFIISTSNFVNLLFLQPHTRLTIVLREEHSHGLFGAVIHQCGDDEQAMPGGPRGLPHAYIVEHNPDGDAAAADKSRHASAAVPGVFVEGHLAHGQPQAWLVAHQVLEPCRRLGGCYTREEWKTCEE